METNNPSNPKTPTQSPLSVRRAKAKAKARNDRDRVIHHDRTGHLLAPLAGCPQPLLAQALEAFQKGHARFRRAKQAERLVARNWSGARKALQAAQDEGYGQLAYVARECRRDAEDSWTGPSGPIEDPAERLRYLVGEAQPSELRKAPGAVKESLETFDLVLSQDEAEAARWKPDFRPAVKAAVERLSQALKAEDDARGQHRRAMRRLRKARAAWDWLFAVLELTVTGYFAQQGEAEDVTAIFRPVRYRGTGDKGNKPPPEPKEDTAPAGPDES